MPGSDFQMKTVKTKQSCEPSFEDAFCAFQLLTKCSNYSAVMSKGISGFSDEVNTPYSLLVKTPAQLHRSVAICRWYEVI
jgi:hypothetical protein